LINGISFRKMAVLKRDFLILRKSQASPKVKIELVDFKSIQTPSELLLLDYSNGFILVVAYVFYEGERMILKVRIFFPRLGVGCYFWL